MIKTFYFILLSFALIACGGDKSILDEEIYEGPIISLFNTYTKHSDDGIVKIIIKAPKQEQYDNGNDYWPEGMLLELYNVETGDLTTTLVADSVSYSKEAGVYKGVGNVIVNNLDTKEQLTTEELFWNPEEKSFYTERFVTIIDEEGLPTYGEGLNANQDFTEYRIIKPLGETNIGQDIR